MNGATMLIMLIVSIGVAATATFLYLQVGGNLQQQQQPTYIPAQVDLVNVRAFNITNGSARYMRIAIQTDEAVDLNDTLIRINTENGSAILQYRNGTLQRDVAEGFYTQ